MQNFTLFTGIAAILAALVFIGAYHTSLRALLTAVFAPVRDAVRDGHDFVWTARIRLGDNASEIRAEHHMTGAGRVGSAVVGALLFTSLFVILSLTEATLNGAVLAAILGQPMADLVHDLAAAIGIDSSDLAGALAFSILGQGILWSAVWTDSRGWTHLAPMGLFNSGEQRWLKLLLYSVLGALGAVVLSLAIFRLPALIGNDVQQPIALVEHGFEWSVTPGLLPDGDRVVPPAETIIDLPGGDIYTPVQQVTVGLTNVLLNATLVVSVFVSGAIALPLLVNLTQLLFCYLLQAVLVVPQIVLNLCTRAIEWAFALFFACFALFARVGTLLAAPLGLLPFLRQHLDIHAPVVPDQMPDSTNTEPTENFPANRAVDMSESEEPEPVMYLEGQPSEPRTDRNWKPYDRME